MQSPTPLTKLLENLFYGKNISFFLKTPDIFIVLLICCLHRNLIIMVHLHKKTNNGDWSVLPQGLGTYCSLCRALFPLPLCRYNLVTFRSWFKCHCYRGLLWPQYKLVLFSIHPLNLFILHPVFLSSLQAIPLDTYVPFYWFIFWLPLLKC